MGARRISRGLARHVATEGRGRFVSLAPARGKRPDSARASGRRVRSLRGVAVSSPDSRLASRARRDARPALVAARPPLPKKRLVRRLEARSIRRLVGRDETRGSISRATHGRSAALPSRTMVKITVRPIPTARRVAPGPARARAPPLPRPLTVSYSALSSRRTKTRRMTRRRRRRTGRTRTRRTSARRFTRR